VVDEKTATPVRVLIVEDDEAAMAVFTDMLEALGATVASVGSVVQARALLESFQPTLVITDVYMPGENGLVMRAEVRHWNPATPVVALTGADDGTVTPDAGFFAVLRKPVSMATLEALLRAVA
jgi:CheY-like chemotaxis protein